MLLNQQFEHKFRPVMLLLLKPTTEMLWWTDVKHQIYLQTNEFQTSNLLTKNLAVLTAAEIQMSIHVEIVCL